MALSDIGTHQAAATEQTNEYTSQLLDCVATYPNDGSIYSSSDTILAAHSEASYLNVRKVRSRASAYIMLSEHNPNLRYNGPVLTIAQIIKFVMSSAAEAELAVIFIVAK